MGGFGGDESLGVLGTAGEDMRAARLCGAFSGGLSSRSATEHKVGSSGAGIEACDRILRQYAYNGGERWVWEYSP